MRLLATLLVLPGLATLLACDASAMRPPRGQVKPPPPQTSAARPAQQLSPAEIAERKLRGKAVKLFIDRCVTCHGNMGAGDGPTAHTLGVDPRNFTSPQWQDSVSDEQIESIIMMGGAAVGKSAVMPANLDLTDQPAIVTALRKLVREFRKDE